MCKVHEGKEKEAFGQSHFLLNLGVEMGFIGWIIKPINYFTLLCCWLLACDLKLETNGQWRRDLNDSIHSIRDHIH